MRFLVLGVACWSFVGVARAQGAAAFQDCLTPREMREAVWTKDVVSPAAAVMTARRAVPNADVVRADLCRGREALVYLIVALRKDGRVVQVTIDAPSGKVKSVH
jgi:uncharacterized membrane protein YkoI